MAQAFLDRAGSNSDDQATVMPFDVPVYIIYHDFSQMKLDMYSKIFNDFQENVWLQDTIRGNVVISPPDRLDIPKACISRALISDPGRRDEILGGQGEQEEPLHYILIVEGKDGDAKWKLLSEDSLDDVATAIMSEILNRYSIVFSGAVFASDLKRLKGRTYSGSFTRAETLAELDEIADIGEGRTIGILC